MKARPSLKHILCYLLLAVLAVALIVLAAAVIDKNGEGAAEEAAEA